MTFVVRKDFEVIEGYLSRLWDLSNSFDSYNRENWSSLKNQYDYSRVYSLENERSDAFQKIYQDGRSIAINLSFTLIKFNYPEKSPTLTDYIELVEDDWALDIEEHEKTLNVALLYQNEKDVPFAVRLC